MEFSSVDAILFDLGGTLRRTTKRDEPEKRQRVEQIRRYIGSELPLEEFSQALSGRYQAYRRWAEKTLVELDEAQLWSKWLAPEVPPEIIRSHAATLNRLWREATGVREVYPETVEVILTLHRRGYLLGVVSNTISRTEIPLALQAAGIAGCFNVVLLSSVFGRRKPDPAILIAAAGKLGVAPAACAYIGNRVDRDVAGARRAGFSTVIIVHHGHHLEKPLSIPGLEPDRTVHSLGELLELFQGKDASKGRS
jgi:putative hydrolase of the HAD superfamily